METPTITWDDIPDDAKVLIGSYLPAAKIAIALRARPSTLSVPVFPASTPLHFERGVVGRSDGIPAPLDVISLPTDAVLRTVQQYYTPTDIVEYDGVATTGALHAVAASRVRVFSRVCLDILDGSVEHLPQYACIVSRTKRLVLRFCRPVGMSFMLTLLACLRDTCQELELVCPHMCPTVLEKIVDGVLSVASKLRHFDLRIDCVRVGTWTWADMSSVKSTIAPRVWQVNAKRASLGERLLFAAVKFESDALRSLGHDQCSGPVYVSIPTEATPPDAEATPSLPCDDRDWFISFLQGDAAREWNAREFATRALRALRFTNVYRRVFTGAFAVPAADACLHCIVRVGLASAVAGRVNARDVALFILRYVTDMSFTWMHHLGFDDRAALDTAVAALVVDYFDIYRASFALLLRLAVTNSAETWCAIIDLLTARLAEIVRAQAWAANAHTLACMFDFFAACLVDDGATLACRGEIAPAKADALAAFVIELATLIADKLHWTLPLGYTAPRNVMLYFHKIQIGRSRQISMRLQVDELLVKYPIVFKRPV